MSIHGFRAFVYYLMRDLKNRLLTIFWIIFDSAIIESSGPEPQKTLVILRTDAIGDYILFRNYLDSIVSDQRYLGWRIILVLNEQVKSFAKTLDAASVDRFIWVDANRMVKDVAYRRKKFVEVRSLGATVIFNAAFSREYILGDAIVRASKAPIAYGSANCSVLMGKWLSGLTVQFYNHKITLGKDHQFESIRNAAMVSEFLGHEISPALSITVTEPFEGKSASGTYCCLCPGAGGSKLLGALKQWEAPNFSILAMHLRDRWALRSMVLGTRAQKHLAFAIALASDHSEHLVDMTGETSPLELITLISRCRLLVSVDTSVIHIASALKVPTICVSNGITFGRFTECPSEIFGHITYVYPPNLRSELQRSGRMKLCEKLKIRSPYSINEIPASDVIEQIDKLLSHNDPKIGS